MSGGHFDYEQYKIDQIACDIEQVIRNNDSEELNEWGDPLGGRFSEKTIEQFSVALFILKLAFIYAHRIDWLLSGDDGEESFHSRLQEEIDGLDSAFLIERKNT